MSLVVDVPEPTPVAPAWGWKRPGGGRAVHVPRVAEYQGTTFQLAGLFPFMAGSGSPTLGVPVGRHMLWGSAVALDPFAWLEAGLVTNPGAMLLGQPGAGKSALAKRLILGLTGFGVHTLILGDTKPDYTRLVEYVGGQVVRVGRGMDRINPLDSGPMRQVLPRLGGVQADQLRLEIRGRRLSLLLALCALIRRHPMDNREEVVLGRAVDLTAERLTDRDPTIPDILAVLEQGPDELRSAARSTGPGDYHTRVDELAFTLNLLCEGSLKGVFDGPTSRPIDLSSPAVSVDISHVAAAGDTLVAAAMLCTWGYGFGLVDAAAVAADRGLAPRRRYLAVMDELWRALRGAPGLVEHADALTRLNRQRGMASLMITHGLGDLQALATEEDRAKAAGFIDRSAIKILAALPHNELDRVSQIVRMSAPERDLVASWAATDAWLPSVHPGRGKYLIKTGEKAGLPVSMTLVGDEVSLYDTDTAVRLSGGDHSAHRGRRRTR